MRGVRETKQRGRPAETYLSSFLRTDATRLRVSALLHEPEFRLSDLPPHLPAIASQLLRQQILLQLPDEVIVYPGFLEAHQFVSHHVDSFQGTTICTISQ